RTSQSKHQEDLRGPAADAFDGDQLAHHFVIRMFLESFQIETAVEHAFRQVLDERDFRTAETAGAYLVVCQRHHTLWGRSAIGREEVPEAREDRRRRFRRQLLGGDRLAERFERILWCNGVQLARPDALDDVPQRRVAFHQVKTGGGGVGLHDAITVSKASAAVWS